MKIPNPKEKEDIENKIIDWIIKDVSDRLTVTKPEEAGAIDLLIKKKAEYAEKPKEKIKDNIFKKIQIFGFSKKPGTKEIKISVNGQIRSAKDDALKKDIDIAKLQDAKNVYLLFVFYDAVKQDIEDSIYLLPIEKFKKDADFSEFLINKNDLGQTLLGLIESK